MKLYLIPTTGQWFGTQDEAKAAARAADTHYDRVEVPTLHKAALIAWLNEHRVGADQPAAPPAGPVIDYVTPPPRQPDPARAAQVDREITIEEAIGEADYPRALRLAEHIHCRLMEHARAAGSRP